MDTSTFIQTDKSIESDPIDPWIQEATSNWKVPYMYTGKELDEDTQLYYYGARYYDPRTSVWQSVDPILGEYLDGKRGMGGVYNSLNLNMFTYTHQNPIKLVDPDGKATLSFEVQANLTVFAKLFKGSGLEPKGGVGGTLGVALSIPTPWDTKDSIVDFGITVSPLSSGSTTASIPSKDKTNNPFSANANLVWTGASVTDLEGGSTESKKIIGPFGSLSRQNSSGETTAEGISIDYKPKMNLSGGLSMEKSTTEVYSARRGINRVGSAAANAATEMAADKSKSFLSNQVDKILNPMPTPQ